MSDELRPEVWKAQFVDALSETLPGRARWAHSIAAMWYVAWAHLEPQQAAYRWLLENGYIKPPAPAPRRPTSGSKMGDQNAEHTAQVIDEAMRRPVTKKPPTR